ncbi:ATP synthase F1 subunit delta [Slackia faecicanis]|uniref:ATP synthase subunit delta n=1 Tax=Slackia faecicanis TaxID=255723 RepID=A0A3N0AG01_9ACTN|nr:ATP synthase F1 subunit delta [Slackia faecicanis]MDO5358429.1 ATP synthase F1 subunit delta [Slackia faecicanis]RNL20732.1 ATP synthase F1 subunit delta [Slackia faecicanis]
MPTNRLLAKEEVATYVNLLLEAAMNEGGQERVFDVRDQLETVLRIYRGNADLRDALVNPAYSPEQRGRLAANVFEGVDPLVNSVIAVMAERGNLGKLSAVVSSFNETSEEKLGVCVVDVTTVVSLDDELRTVITDKLSKDLGKNVVLREHIDKSILGGIIMSTHGKRIDASVASQLERTRNVLTESNDGGEC